MAPSDFDLAALYAALDGQRQARRLTWATAAAEINAHLPGPPTRPLSVSTIRGIKDRASVEGDGVLQMLLWLQRSPESFVRSHERAHIARAKLPHPGHGKVLRFDVPKLHRALDAQRTERDLSWKDVTAIIDSPFAATVLARLAQNSRTSFPFVMRLTAWLQQPVAVFTRVTSH